MNGSWKDWWKILIIVVPLTAVGYARLVVVENTTQNNKGDITRMDESWLSPQDVSELKSAIKALTKEVTELKVTIAGGQDGRNY